MKTVFLALLLAGSISAFAQEHTERDREKQNNRDRNQYNQNSQYNNNQYNNRDRNQNNQNDHRDVPPNVYNNFSRENPQANNARWERSQNGWHANYQDRDRNVDSYYDNRGRRIDSHIPWDNSRLPQGYNERIYSRYHTRDYKVYRVERPNSTPLFQLLLNLGGNNNRTIYTDQYGNPVQYRDRH